MFWNQYLTRMSKQAWLFSLSLTAALLLGFTGNAEDLKADLSKVPPALDKKGVTFEKDIKVVFEKSCVKCHGGDKPKGKYRMDTLAAIVKGGVSGEAAIIPGQSVKSPLVLYIAGAVEDMEMPPEDNRDKYPALTKEEIGLVRAWIDAGAK
jgi:hypothetical protein